MKTIKQMADDIGIDKQRVYRYIKKHHINEAHHDVGVMYFDEAVEVVIKSAFIKNTVSSEAHHEAHQTTSNDTVVDAVLLMLREELEAKNKLIEELSATIKNLSESINAVHKNELAETIIDGNKRLIEENKIKNRGGIFKIFSRKK